jgi:hypothetical protein
MRRNTIWQDAGLAAFQEGTGVDTLIEANVVERFWTSTDLSAIAYRYNTPCIREASGGFGRSRCWARRSTARRPSTPPQPRTSA